MAFPPYTGPMPVCPKCGCVGATTTFLPTGTCIHRTGDDYDEILDHQGLLNERLHRCCERCGHQWDEACLDDPFYRAEKETETSVAASVAATLEGQPA